MGMGRGVAIAMAIGAAVGIAPPASGADLLVANYFGSNILRYDGATGVYKGVFASGGALANPYGIVYGPDGHLYVSNAPFGARQILRLHGTTGAFLGVFASGSGLYGNKGLTFGPEGNLYVANSNTHEVLRFDGRTGAPLPAPGRAGAVFAAGGGLLHTNDCAFGPDGHLYAVGSPSSCVYKFDGTTGAFMGIHASGPEYAPRGLEAVTFGPGGRLYVYDCDTVAIWREDGLGGFEVFVSNAGISQARGHIIFGPDAHLYVGDNAGGSSRVLRFHGQTGAALPAPGRTGSDFAIGGGLSLPGGLAFMLPANRPPVAHAGPDQVVEQASAAGAQVTLDGSASSEPDGNPLSYRWTWPGGSASGVNPTITLPLGTTTVTLVVNDGQADSAPDTVLITVRDATPPTLVVPAPIVVEQATAAGTRVSWDWVAADVCDAEVDVVCSPPSGSVFPLGVTAVTCTATDDSGNQTVKTFTVTVKDTTAPVIESVWATPNVLWPPNHKMANIAVGAVVGDVCDAAPGWRIVGVASNEPVNGLGDGDAAPDWEITGDHSLKLRAERSGKGSGRVYTITIEATDASGNAATAQVTVSVPHDQKK